MKWKERVDLLPIMSLLEILSFVQAGVTFPALFPSNSRKQGHGISSATLGRAGEFLGSSLSVTQFRPSSKGRTASKTGYQCPPHLSFLFLVSLFLSALLLNSLFAPSFHRFPLHLLPLSFLPDTTLEMLGKSPISLF